MSKDKTLINVVPSVLKHVRSKPLGSFSFF